MRTLPNMKLYKECPECEAWTFRKFDRFCAQCGAPLKDPDEWPAGINDYAKSLLIEYLDKYPDLAQEAEITEIPDHATGDIRTRGSIVFSQGATHHVLAESWNEVEIALDDWRETNGSAIPVKNIEQLHVFAVTQHAKMVWLEIIGGFNAAIHNSIIWRSARDNEEEIMPVFLRIAVYFIA